MKPLVSFLPILCISLFLAACVGAVVLAGANGGEGRAEISLLVATGVFTLVGAAIAARRPGNPIGWLFITIGIFWSLGSLGVEYSVYGTVTEPGSVPAPWLGAWFGEWNWIVFWYSTLVVTPILFPNGRPMSRRWAWGLAFILSVAFLEIGLAMFDQHLELEGAGKAIDNPIGASFGSDPDDEGSIASYLLPLTFASAAAGIVAVILRFRRSRGEERQQMKWLTFGSCVAIASFLAAVIWDGVTGYQAPSIVFATGVAAVPTGAGIAILRYRLYDIDVFINRALVYGALTAVLAAAYLAIVFGLQSIFRLGDSDVAVAASTLAVAGLFRPVRAGVQRFIDRRFYRSRYDSAETLARFGARLRDQVDVDDVKGDTLEVVATTVQPLHASIWLREAM